MPDILERLRREHALLCPDGSPYLAGEAADEIERLREALELLRQWDGLITHQYSGTRQAMSDMTHAAQKTAAFFAKVEEPKP